MTKFFLSDLLRDYLTGLAMLTPLIFACVVMLIATIDSIRHSHAARNQKARDELTMDVLRLVHQADNTGRAIVDVHRKLCSYLAVSRSTLYTVDGHALHSLSIVGAELATGTGVSRSVEGESGILGYVRRTGQPILVQDLARDHRFHAQKDHRASYRTGSCMILPLYSMGIFLGILTLADKQGDLAFNDTDFAAALDLSATLSLLLRPNPQAPPRLRAS